MILKVCHIIMVMHSRRSIVVLNKTVELEKKTTEDGGTIIVIMLTLMENISHQAQDVVHIQKVV